MIESHRILTGYLINENRSLKEKFTRVIVKVLRSIADLVYGVSSGFPMCCILAYIKNKDIYYIPGIERALCSSCYIKIMKSYKYTSKHL